MKIKNLQQYAKAIVAFFAPTITQLVLVLKESISTKTAVDWQTFGADALIYLLVAGIVWAVPNTPPTVVAALVEPAKK